MNDSHYMYLSSFNEENLNKAIALNTVPYHYAPLTEGEWKVAALHGKVSKTWSTIPDVSCIVERLTDEDEKSMIALKVYNQRMEKVSEMMAKLREELASKLKDINEPAEDWVKFGGTGAASRRIALAPKVKIVFSLHLRDLLGISDQVYDNSDAEAVLNIPIRRDYLNIKNYNVLYVMCRDIQGVYANNRLMGILTDITADSKLIGGGDSIEFTNQNPVYHNWRGGSIDKIEAYFTDSSGNVLQINDGYTFILLHFVKIK